MKFDFTSEKSQVDRIGHVRKYERHWRLQRDFRYLEVFCASPKPAPISVKFDRWGIYEPGNHIGSEQLNFSKKSVILNHPNIMMKCCINLMLMLCYQKIFEIYQCNTLISVRIFFEDIT